MLSVTAVTNAIRLSHSAPESVMAIHTLGVALASGGGNIRCHTLGWCS